MKKLIIVLLVFTSAFLGASEPVVIATTEWTAAFCRAAGLEEVTVLAPASLQHPPDYELKPSDIALLDEADIIVFAGYEAMVDRISRHVARSDVEMLQITTRYVPRVLEESILKIAEAAGTTEIADRNIAKIREAWSEARNLVDSAVSADIRVAVHFHQVPFAKTVGLNQVIEFGPAPPGPRLIGEAAGSGARLILDNWHNSISAPFREVLPEASVAELINFPGRGGTVTLDDVILYNAGQVAAALKN